MANEVVINVRAMTGEATKSMTDLKGRMEGMAKKARTAGIALSAMGAGGALAIRGFVGAAIEQNKALDTLGAIVTTTGASFDAVKGKILETTAALQDKTNFGDEAQIRTLTILTTILGDVDQAMAALPAVMDASSASGLQMESVAKTMGKALAGQVHQAESVGVVFDKTAGFTERLNQILGKVGGAAEANADPFTQLGNSLGDLKETIGNALIPVLTPLVEWLREMLQKAQNMNPTFLKLGAVLAVVATAIGLVGGPILLLLSMIPSLVAGITAVKVAFMALVGSTGIGLVVLAVGALAILFVTKFDFIKETVGNALQFILDKFVEWGRKIARPMDALIKTFNALTGTSIPLLSDKLDELSKVTIDWGNKTVDVTEEVRDRLNPELSKVADTIRNEVIPATIAVKAATEEAFSPFMEYAFRLQAMNRPMEDLTLAAKELSSEFGISMAQAIDYIANIKLGELRQEMREAAEGLLGMNGDDGGGHGMTGGITSRGLPLPSKGQEDWTQGAAWQGMQVLGSKKALESGDWAAEQLERVNQGGKWDVSEQMVVFVTLDGKEVDDNQGEHVHREAAMSDRGSGAEG